MSRAYEIVLHRESQNDSEDNFFCNLCGFTLRTEGDHQSHSDHQCCKECFLTFAEFRKNEWSLGWRPKKSVVRKYINNKKRLIINAAKH